MRTTPLLLSVAAVVASVACDKGGEGTRPAPSASATAAPTATVAPAAAPSAVASTATSAVSSSKVEIQIGSVGETMAFDKTALTVPDGAEVHLVFKNSSTSPLLPHNWVLVMPGTEAAVALAGVQKLDTGYVVPSASVLAYTPLAKHGETTEVTFKAPAAGKYPYICTVPGHYIMMKGVLTVTP